MTERIDEYTETDDLNEKYRLLREEATRLRGQGGHQESYDGEAVKDSLRDLSQEVEGQLIVFVANDFGYPKAFRPEGIDQGAQDEIRQSILGNKYSTNSDLDEIRRELLDRHPGIHKAIIAEYRDGNIRYHLPEGSNTNTNFLTVREMVGLIDYTTNSAQSEGQSKTY